MFTRTPTYGSFSAALSSCLLATVLGTGCGRSSASSAGQEPVSLQGAGASFPAPLYTSWIKAYGKAHPNIQIDYQSVGSGSGVKSVIDRMVDFGASDAAMTPQEMARVPGGVQLFPMTAGAIVLTYNLEGVQHLKLSRKAYTGIFLGRIKNWSDPEIANTNRGVSLPDKPINVVVRADSSGTTFVFTQHLSAVSPEFQKNTGVNKMPNWAVGTRSKGNEGVTAAIKTTPGAIGYIEYGYADSQHLPKAQLENKTGHFVEASTASGQAALAETKLPDNLIAWNPDPAGASAYPIVTYTWLILYKEYKDAHKLTALKDFVKFGLADGQEQAEQLGYVPLPSDVTTQVRGALERVRLSADTK